LIDVIEALAIITAKDAEGLMYLSFNRLHLPTYKQGIVLTHKSRSVR
jgi:hypothetical protein